MLIFVCGKIGHYFWRGVYAVILEMSSQVYRQFLFPAGM